MSQPHSHHCFRARLHLLLTAGLTLTVMAALLLAFPLPSLAASAGKSRAARAIARESTREREREGAKDDNKTKDGVKEPLTIGSVREQLGRVEKEDKLAPEVKTNLIALLNQTLVQLQAIEDWKTKAADYEKRQQDAPAQLVSVKAELAQPPAEPPKPQVPENATVATLDALLNQQNAAKEASDKEFSDQERRRKVRTDRRKQIPEEIAAARKNLDEANKAAHNRQLAGKPRPLIQAQLMLDAVTAQAFQQQIAALQKEQACYDATGELLDARRELASRHKVQAENVFKAWSDLVEKQRQLDAERVAAEARRTLAQVHPAVRQLAEENQQMAEKRTGDGGLAHKIAQTTREIEVTDGKLDKIKAEFENIQNKNKIAGLSNTIGMLLRKQRRELVEDPDIRGLRQSIRERQTLMPNVNLELTELDDKRAALADDIEQEVKTFMRKLNADVPQAQRMEIDKATREILTTRKDLLAALIKDDQDYFLKLVDLDVAQRSLSIELDAYMKYIDERVLWIRSTEPIGLSIVPDTFKALRWLADPDDWKAIGRSTLQKIQENALLALLALALLVALYSYQRRFRTKITALGRYAEGGSCMRFLPTLECLTFTLLASIFWPIVLLLVGWLLVSPADTPDLGKALGTGLLMVAAPYLVIELLRQVSREKGLAEAHFGWPAPALELVHAQLYRLQAVGLPFLFVAAVMNSQPNEVVRESLGRLAMIGGLVALTIFMHRMFQPTRGAFLPILIMDPRDWAARLRPIWYPVAVGIPALLAVIAVLGYSYTAQQLAGRLLASIALIIGLMLVNELMHRLLGLLRRRLDIRQAQRQAAAPANKENEASSPMPPDLPNLPAKPEVDLYAVNIQSSRIMKSLIGFALLIGIWLIWVDVLPALGALRRVELWYDKAPVAEAFQRANGAASQADLSLGNEAKVPVTLADLSLCLIIFLMTAVAGGNIPGLLEILLLQRIHLEAGVRFAITTISRYLIVAVGIVVALGTIRIGWGKVQWLIAAMTVGLGFGLQEIFANFVSGLIILFERPIRVGDIVTVKDITGTVSHIQMRATTITDGDRRELIVPNKEFITGQIINWTLSDPITRVVIPINIACGSDTDRVRRILIEIATAHPSVMQDPAPAAAFVGFGESSLDFKLYVHIPQRNLYLDVVHDLHTAIDQAFREAGVEIAYPHRDLHLDASRPLDVRVVPNLPPGRENAVLD